MKILKHKSSPLYLFLLILFVSFILKLLISRLIVHVDLLSNSEWGEWIFFHGPKGFYENNIWTYSWPTQPPLASYIYGFDRYLYYLLLELFRNIGHFIVNYHIAPWHLRFWFAFTTWFDQAKINPEVAFPIGYFMTIKLLPIIADSIIALIIYSISTDKRRGVFLSSIYLISPFSWYISSLWGQIDQLSFVPLILAFIFESKRKYPILNFLLIALSISIKPTGLILLPLFLYIHFKNKHNLFITFTGVLSVVLFFVVTTNLFINTNPFIYAKEVLYPKIFLKSEFRVSTNSFNFWRIFIGNKAYGDTMNFLFLPARYWGITMWAIINIFAIKLLKEINLKNVIYAFFIVAAGSWLFMTNMLDRYFFAGIVGGLFVCLYHPNLFKYWFTMSLIFFLNLFNQWWYPESLHLLKQILIWNESLTTRILALINVLFYLIMIRKLIFQKTDNVLDFKKYSNG